MSTILNFWAHMLEQSAILVEDLADLLDRHGL